MSKLENRVEKLEAKQPSSGGIFIFYDHGNGDREKQLQEFIDEHGHEPECLTSAPLGQIRILL